VKSDQAASAPGLRNVYRKVAKCVHPDLAINEADRLRRERVMKDANAAYQKRNLGTLRKILTECERSRAQAADTVPADANGWHKLGIRHWSDRKYGDAVRCFARALELNAAHIDSQFYLGLAYYQGVGVPKTDRAQAVVLWEKAAEHGSAEAENNLGQAYEAGDGVEKDLCKAVVWFRRAAERNHVTSQFNLGVMYELGRGVPQDYAQAAHWYQKAAEQGYAPAQFNLATMYELGQGVARDLSQAASCYHEAAECGYEPAREALWEVLRKIEGPGPQATVRPGK
jgi:TPR repeat protein